MLAVTGLGMLLLRGESSGVDLVALWLTFPLLCLPFLAVVAVPPRWLAIFAVTDIWLWLQWSWLWSAPDWMLWTAMAARGLALVGLTVVLLRSPIAIAQWPGSRLSARSPATSTQPSTAAVATGAAN